MHIVIIGNGISGITAARHIRKQTDHRITVISAESDYFFSRTALMYIYMGHMTFEHTKPYEDHFWAKNRIGLKRGYVKGVLPEKKTLLLDSGDSLSYDKLIIATGSQPNKFGWPGQELEGVQGLYSLQDLQALEENAPDNRRCSRAVIVGGGLIGIELAEMLRSREIPVTFLVRESSFWNGVLPPGESRMINEHIREHHVDLRLGTNLMEILPDDQGRARAVVTDQGETIECQLVGLTAGVRPNIGFLRGSGIETDKGVLVDRYLGTNLPDVYAIGDCAQQRTPLGNRRAVEAVWYTGRMMGETVARTVCGNPTPYNPGHWFNSAKFFDIEYQTYGWVSSELHKDETEMQFHWRHPSEKICLTLAYEREGGTFLGINTFGIRMRHAVLDRWLSEKLPVEEVVSRLGEANFDPEFYARHETMVEQKFQTQMNNAS
ncbi:MAG: FAD/NAD(P)-binding oxidoreductase [Robiginitalea sp.]|nr:FAD/NAD(P)-binding oxidoreductase [Robiginitalea sp.]